MEPVDDILIPRARPARNVQRIRTRRILRVLSLLLFAFASGYAFFCLRTDELSSRQQRLNDVLGVAPVLLFCVGLWWYAGKALPDLPKSTAGKGDAEASVQNGLWLAACMVAGFLGLSSVTFGATMAWRGERLKNSFPVLKRIEIPSNTILLIGVLLLVTAFVAFLLARKKPAVATS